MKPMEMAASTSDPYPQTGECEPTQEPSAPTDRQLLDDYATTQSEDAFAEIVSRHAGFVYSAALRQTENRTAAEEITQAVFILLARKASALRRETLLQGWLFRTVHYGARDFRKREVRRFRREREAVRMNATNASEESESAWEQMAPLIDEALASLSTTDRHAILLRFFENKGFRDIGAVLGGNENSARLRVVRALERLRGWFQKRGVVLSAAGLSSTLLVPSLHAAPPALATTVLSALASGHCPGGVALFIREILRRLWWKRWSRRIAGAGIAVLLALMVIEWVWHNPVPTPAQTRTTALAIDRAISFGDADALISSVHFRDSKEERFQPVLAAFIQAAVALRQQIRQSFDAQPVRLKLWLWTARQLFQGQPRRDDVHLPLNRVIDDFFQPYLLVMVKVKGTWKWDYFASLPPDIVDERLKILREKTAACERVARQIQDGEIRTAEQALALVQGQSN